MTRCQFCGQQIDDISAHYGSDACPALLSALGAVADAGRRREADTHHRLNTMERALNEMRDHPTRTVGRSRALVLGKLTVRRRG